MMCIISKDCKWIVWVLLTVNLLEHDGVEKVSRRHVRLVLVNHGGKLDKTTLPGRRLRARSFLKQRIVDIYTFNSKT